MSVKNGLPCLLLLFRRSQNVDAILERCLQGGVTRFFFAIDGPRHDYDKKMQEKLIDKVSMFCEMNEIPFSVSYLKMNRGIFINMVTALEWFFDAEDFGVILEDDTIPEIEFLNFVRHNRMYLAQNREVMMISGWRGVDNFRDSSSSLQFCSYPLIWGWATSKEKWGVIRRWFFENSSSRYVVGNLFTPSMGFWRTGYLRAVKGRLDSWANILAFHFASNGYKSIVPERSLITNVGFDEFSTNSKKSRSCTLKKRKEQNLLELDKWLETRVYRISRRHAFAPLYAPILDLFKGPPKRVPPLPFLQEKIQLVNNSSYLRDLL
jgi:hypothetical protein